MFIQCKIHDCERAMHAKGYCKKHYERLRVYGDPQVRLTTDPNEIVMYDEYAEIVLYNRTGEESGRAQIDLKDIPKVEKYKWHLSNGYVETRVSGKNILLHRLLMGSPNCFIDHINGVPTDNRRCNLRTCNEQENVFNSAMKSHNTSGFRGVTWHKRHKKWMAAIYINRTTKCLGYFENKEDAYKARLVAETEYFGEFSPTVSRKENFYAHSAP